MPIELTAAAAEKIINLMNEENSKGIRINLKNGGCAGMEYSMEHAYDDDANDMVIEQDGARVLIGPTAQMFMFGTEIDYVETVLESGFKFKNPNVTETCGCGESIGFDMPVNDGDG